jgi:hypothetical protein
MALLMVSLFMVAVMALTASVALADNPHAGQSGHFKNNSNPCQNNDDHKKCPPFGR